ncbi:protein phosphatase 1 regulatory subunit 37 isoform X2 [Lampris incognitus]|uniref:protein phosphatase 1 regulatory subunit 37 isoform X2 n=1 Tax=Lampris incognitus TaxID=2546036 RepID=UPI0024B5CD50|nr:protein phosphatase 1 regulatory subunit 37 isoform X2 [Lampris incognitus]
MNIEEQSLDLCNVKTKSSVDDDPNTNTEGVIPCITELMMDGDVGKPPDTYLLPRVTEAEEDNHQAQEVNGNNSSVQDVHTRVKPAELNKGDIQVECIKEDKDTSTAKVVMGEGDDGGDMDIGVDLSLNECGVLEAEPTTNLGPSLSGKRSASLCTKSELAVQDVNTDGEKGPSDTNHQSTIADPVQDQVLLSANLEEKHKPGGKRVTFPSDEDIVSGAVEPKDPWRHAQNVTVEEILSAYRQACQKLNCKPIPKVLKQIQGASALFDMIEYYESATHLNISFNKHIGTRGWQAAAHMMRKTSSLQYLDARNTPLLDHSAPFVARALRISGSLAVLHLENAGLSGRPLMLLATALKMNMNLRELYLADNKLNGLQDSAQLGNLLKFNYNIQILDLRNNHILDSGLAYVCEGLKEQRKGLVTLVLWNNQLTHNGMGYLAAALPCTQSLETLNLGHNSVGNEGVHKLKDGLIANRSVLRLGLASTKLSCEGAVAVAEFIAESPRLLRLDLRENEIKTGGLMALSLALKVNTSLLRLDLDREPKKETVKSFIETQRALLAEIQNGCKRNFILAKEKEETEQKMRQSASMAEIATEDTTGAEEGEAVAEEQSEGGGKDSEEVKGTECKEGQTSSQTEACPKTETTPVILESESDTEDEEEEALQSKVPAISISSPNQTTSPAQTAVVLPPLSASQMTPPPFASHSGGQSVISGITVTESKIPPGTPPSPGRCISVSSPGRGHKIFMVTRVESPPDQQQVLLQQQKSNGQPSASAAPMREAVAETINRSTDPVAPETKYAHSSVTSQPSQEVNQSLADQSPASTQTQLMTKEEGIESSSALSTDCKPTEQSPPVPSQTAFLSTQSAVDSYQTHILEPQSSKPCEPTEGITASHLESEVTEQTHPALVVPSYSSPEQAAVHTDPLQTQFQITQEVTESTSDTQLHPATVEQQFSQGKQEGMREESWGLEKEETPVISPDSTEGECKQSEHDLGETQTSIPADKTKQMPLAVKKQQQSMAPVEAQLLASSSPEPQTQKREQTETLAQQRLQEAPVSLSENQSPGEGAAEKEDCQRTREPTPKLAREQQQQTEPDQQEMAQPVLPVQEPALWSQEETQRPNLQLGQTSQNFTMTTLSHALTGCAAALEVGPISLLKAEESFDERSADKGEHVADMGEVEGEVVGSVLPNGLKPEFSLHLLDPESPKPSSCVMEHVSVTAELSCGQDLEELLRDASLETGRDTP